MTEIERPQEREVVNTSRSDTYIARIFLQTPDALNSEVPLVELSVGDLAEFGKDKADLLNRASVYTATDYWRKKDGGNLSYDQQMQVFRSQWVKAGQDRYRSLLKDGSSDEYKDDYAKREVEYLRKIGIDLSNFDEKAVQDFYAKYLDNGRDLMGFIDTLFYADGVEDEVMEHLDAIRFLAGMFDRETALDIEGVLSLMASDDLDEFRQKAINNPRVIGQSEKDRLRLFSDLMAGKSGKVKEEPVVRGAPVGSSGKPPEKHEAVIKPEPTAKIETGKKTSMPVQDKPSTKPASIEPQKLPMRTVETAVVKPVKDTAGSGDGATPIVAEADGERLKSPASSSLEDDKIKLAESGRDGYRVATAEDLRRVEESIKDKEHVHVHPQAFVIPDTHGLKAEAIVERVREMAGSGADVRYNPTDGKVTINGQEAHIYGLGDMFDLNKDINRQMFMSEERVAEAAGNPNHPLHNQANEIVRKMKNDPSERDNYRDHWERMADYNLTTAEYSFWKQKIENGEVVLGNHELTMLAGILGGDEALLLWLNPQQYSDLTYKLFSGQSVKNIASNALRQAGVDLSQYSNSNFSPLSYRKYMVNGKEDDLTAEMARELRKFFLNSRRGKECINLLLKNFKLYNVVNGVLLTHAGIPIDKDGNLIAPESTIPDDGGTDMGKADFEAAIRGRKGIELYDTIEEMVRNSEPGYMYALQFLASGSSDLNSPVNMRQNFQSTMSSNGARVLSQLNDQMRHKGGPRITRIMVGHTPNVNGKMWGSRLLGADDKRGSAVRLDLSTKDAPDDRLDFRVDVRSKHNFDQAGTIQDKLERA